LRIKARFEELDLRRRHGALASSLKQGRMEEKEDWDHPVVPG